MVSLFVSLWGTLVSGYVEVSPFLAPLLGFGHGGVDSFGLLLVGWRLVQVRVLQAGHGVAYLHLVVDVAQQVLLLLLRQRLRRRTAIVRLEVVQGGSWHGGSLGRILRLHLRLLDDAQRVQFFSVGTYRTQGGSWLLESGQLGLDGTLVSTHFDIVYFSRRSIH